MGESINTINFDGHQLIKLDANGKWVLDITENVVYSVSVNANGEPCGYRTAMTISDDCKVADRFVDMPIKIIRRAIEKYREYTKKGKKDECIE